VHWGWEEGRGRACGRLVVVRLDVRMWYPCRYGRRYVWGGPMWLVTRD
jgi:hypothetical protein